MDGLFEEKSIDQSLYIVTEKPHEALEKESIYTRRLNYPVRLVLHLFLESPSGPVPPPPSLKIVRQPPNHQRSSVA